MAEAVWTRMHVFGIGPKIVTAHRYTTRESTIEGAEHWGWTCPDGLSPPEVEAVHAELRRVESHDQPEEPRNA